MIKNILFRDIIYSNLILFMFNNILIHKNIIVDSNFIHKYIKNDCKLVFFKSKKNLNNYTFHLNYTKQFSLNYFKKTKPIKEKLILINSYLKKCDNILNLNILVLNENNSSESNDILGFNSLFFLKKTYIQNGVMFCYVVHKWQNFNTAIIIAPVIIFKNSLDLTVLKVISNFIKYISITSILFFKNCNIIDNLDFSLSSIKMYLEKFISYYLVKNNMILIIPLRHDMNFKRCYLKNDGVLKNICKQFKHVKFLTNMKQEVIWNNWINFIIK